MSSWCVILSVPWDISTHKISIYACSFVYNFTPIYEMPTNEPTCWKREGKRSHHQILLTLFNGKFMLKMQIASKISKYISDSFNDCGVNLYVRKYVRSAGICVYQKLLQNRFCWHFWHTLIYFLNAFVAFSLLFLFALDILNWMLCVCVYVDLLKHNLCFL